MRHWNVFAKLYAFYIPKLMTFHFIPIELKHQLIKKINHKSKGSSYFETVPPAGFISIIV